MAQDTGEEDARLLDLAHPHLYQRVDNDSSAAFDFVRVSVAQVSNPKRIGLIFDVAFVADNGSRVQLGGFSLYPPDNPGTFIVSTRRVINSPGCIVVSLHTATPVDPETVLSVMVGSITLSRAP